MVNGQKEAIDKRNVRSVTHKDKIYSKLNNKNVSFALCSAWTSSTRWRDSPLPLGLSLSSCLPLFCCWSSTNVRYTQELIRFSSILRAFRGMGAKFLWFLFMGSFGKWMESHRVCTCHDISHAQTDSRPPYSGRYLHGNCQALYQWPIGHGIRLGHRKRVVMVECRRSTGLWSAEDRSWI